MSGIIITPSYFVTMESNMQAIMVDRWVEFASDPQLSY